MATLEDIREQWENGLEVLADIPDDDNQFMSILIDGNFPPEKYFMHRYFKLGADWQISVDYNGTSLTDLIIAMGGLTCWAQEIPEE